MKVEGKPMDELEFRRAVYADPYSNDPRIKAAAEADPAKKAFLAELRQLDANIAQASKVPVPDDLAHKLIWQGTITEFSAHKKKTRSYIALAASVAFMFGISFTMWNQSSEVNFSDEALAHMYYTEFSEASRASTVSMHSINDKLERFGASLVSDIGTIKSANHCKLDSVKSLHLILETASGMVSVFILPSDADGMFESEFSDFRYSGETLNNERANVLVVGKKGQNLKDVKQQVKEKLLFSA